MPFDVVAKTCLRNIMEVETKIMSLRLLHYTRELVITPAQQGIGL